MLQIPSLLDDGFNIYLKNYEIYLNSVKERGLLYVLTQLSAEHNDKGFITISVGINSACYSCYFSSMLNLPLTIVMPTSTPSNIVKLCRGLKARVYVEGNNMLEVPIIALRIAEKKGSFYFDGYFLHNWM